MEHDPDCHTAELAASYVLDLVIDAGAQKLYEDYLESKVIPTTLELFLGLLSSSLEMEFLRMDPGEPIDWKPDPESIPPPTDSWARGHISVRKVYREVEVAPSPVSLGMKSFRSSFSQKSLMQKSTNSLQYSQPILERPQPYVIESALEKSDTELDLLRVNKERELQQRKIEAEKERTLKRQRDEEMRRMDRIASDLRRSNFTYDYDGNILPMKLRPLPNPNYVQYGLPVVQEEQSALKPKHAVSPKRPVQIVKKAPASELQFVKAINMAPSVMELLKLTSGVTAFESNRSKRGPEFRYKTMTREEYKALVGSPEPEYEEKQCQEPKRTKQMHSRKLLSDIPDSDRDEEVTIQSTLPNLVSTEELTMVDKFNLQILKSPDWGLNTASLSPMNSSPVPGKPDFRMVQETHGRVKKKPRDRPFIDRKPVRERLPPPRLGKTMGHGLVDPDFSP